MSVKIEESSTTQCPVCEQGMTTGIYDWHLHCHHCAYEKSTLSPTINDSESHRVIDETKRENALKALRITNFQTLINHLKQLKHKQCDLLEVGSAHGWFLKEAAHHFSVYGIEPDQFIFNKSLNKENVRLGYFPDILNSTETFDIIIFNDVFEHIPNINQIAQSCKKHLNQHGLLVINLPSSSGIFYKLANLLAKIGYGQFFERLWQKDMPSPHLHYFNQKNLCAFLTKNQFKPIKKGHLNAVNTSNLYNRIMLDNTNKKLVGFITYVCVLFVMPILNLLPKDIVFIIAEKTDEPA